MLAAMKRLVVCTALLCVGGLMVLSCKREVADKPSDTGAAPSFDATAPARAATQKEWKTRESSEGGFSVVAPSAGQITYGKQKVAGVGEAKTTTILYQRDTDPGALMVMFMDMPVPDGTALAVEKGLEDGRDRAVGTYNGKLTADKRIEINGNPAREFEFEATMPGVGQVHAIMRGAFRGKRIYMVGAVAEKGAAEFQNRGAEFVRSFKIHMP